MPTNKILVPVDFSEPSGRALDHALELARTFGASIELLHVYHLAIIPTGPYAEPLPVEYTQGLRKGAEAELATWLERVKASGVSGKAHLVEGTPAHEIVEASKRLGADLIVIGTRGLTGLKHLMLGSVAERVVRTAHCPVTTVPADGD